MYKEDLLKKLRKNTTLQFDMPKTTVKGITYPDVVKQYINMCETVGCKVIEAKKNDDLNAIIRKAYPNAKVFASNVKGIEADRTRIRSDPHRNSMVLTSESSKVTSQLQRMDVSGYHKP